MYNVENNNILSHTYPLNDKYTLSMENVLSPLTTAIVTVIINKLKLNNIYYGLMYTCVLQLLEFLPRFLSIQLDYLMILITIGITISFACLTGIIYYCFFYIKYATITIYDEI